MKSHVPADAGASQHPSRHSVPMTQPIIYQSRDEKLAELKALIGEAARGLRAYARTEREQSDCDDAIRGHRLSFRVLNTLVCLAGRSEQPFVLETAIRDAVISEVASPSMCAFEASELEQQANEPLNYGQLLAAKEDTPTRWVTVAELAAQQEFASRRLHEASLRRAARLSA